MTDSKAGKLTKAEDPSAYDRLRMDYINSLPQPFIVRFCGSTHWWPVESFEVQTGLMRIDVCGKLEVKRFSEVMEIKDGDNQPHDPDSFWIEDCRTALKSGSAE